MGRSPCCEKAHTNKGAWTKEEDQRLTNYIRAHGEGCWRSLPKAAGLLRCGKSCRLRWINYLRPDLKRGNFTEDEDEIIIKLHGLLGNKWSLIAGRLPGRTDNEIKNYWNTHIKRKLITRGIDPQTHRQLSSAVSGGGATAAVNTYLDFRNSASPPSKENSAISIENTKCNSSTTEEFQTPAPAASTAPEESAGHALDLDLSIGLPSQSTKYAKSASFDLTSSWAEPNQSFLHFLRPPAVAAVVAPVEAVTSDMCLCRQLGFQNGQLCSNCRSLNGLYGFC
ncbi:hypothetical protein CASFOL_016399 [Castilleja foliolosa]|uniref:Uncharacterized protein n=1 Tax=Castilleja foliolosa TaxID=1961234 RepID=A0ABD3DIF3_9LAMI